MRSALANGFPMVMVHENDKGAGGCDFVHFFVTTPQDRTLSLTLALPLTLTLKKTSNTHPNP